MKNKEIKQIDLQIKKLVKKKRAFEKEDFLKTTMPNFLKQKGRCFIYEGNQFSGGTETWNVYYRILDVEFKVLQGIMEHEREGAVYTVESFQKDADGKMTFTKEKEVVWSLSSMQIRGRKLMSKTEYLKLRADFLLEACM